MYDCTRVASGMSMPMVPSSPLRVGRWPDGEIVLVPSTGLSEAGARSQRCRKKAPTPRAVAFSMIDEITSLTPR